MGLIPGSAIDDSGYTNYIDHCLRGVNMYASHICFPAGASSRKEYQVLFRVTLFQERYNSCFSGTSAHNVITGPFLN